MQMPIRIPDVDPLPLPGPVWLFKFLLLFTFTLHLVAMNCALAGGVAAVLNAIRGRNPLHPFSRRLAGELSRMLPVFLALTITSRRGRAAVCAGSVRQSALHQLNSDRRLSG